MSAQYIGVPEYDSDDDVFFSFLEFQHQLFRIILKEDLICPDLLDLPNVPYGYRLEEMSISHEMDEVLRTSAMIRSGLVDYSRRQRPRYPSNLTHYRSDATIRVPESEPDCIIKCALPSSRSRARVAYEYWMLNEIEQLPTPLPVVRIRGQALVDSQGIFAFRLQKLQEWDATADLSRSIRAVAKALHKRGISHNDLRRPNLLRDGQFPALIDFDRAGFIGSSVPTCVMSSSRKFSVNEDIKAMRHFGGLTVIDVAFSRFWGLIWTLRWTYSESWPTRRM